MGEKTIWIKRALVALGVAVAVGAIVAPAVRAQAESAAVRTAESPAANLVADAIRYLTGADLALVPAGTFRASGGAQGASASDALGLIGTASDTVVVMNLTGKQITDALERSVSFAPKPFAGFLQVSGIEFRYAPKRPNGSRVLSVRKGGRALDPSARYKVAMPRPLADGQLGYFQIWSKDQIATDTGKSLKDALASVSGGGRVEGRIVAADE